MSTYRSAYLQVVSNGASEVTDSDGSIIGYIDEINIGQLDGNCSSTVTVQVIPVGQMDVATTTLATAAALSTDKVFRPRFDTTNAAGAALTSDPPTRFLVTGETVQLVVSSANVSGQTITAQIKYQRD